MIRIGQFFALGVLGATQGPAGAIASVPRSKTCHIEIGSRRMLSSCWESVDECHQHVRVGSPTRTNWCPKWEVPRWTLSPTMTSPRFSTRSCPAEARSTLYCRAVGRLNKKKLASRVTLLDFRALSILLIDKAGETLGGALHNLESSADPP